MEVSYGDSQNLEAMPSIPSPPSIPSIPSGAQHTEITTYMWPGFLGEFIHSTMEFDVWELVGPTHWIPRPDILAPPRECLGIETTKGWRWTSSFCSSSPETRWLAYPELSLWRRLQSVPETQKLC